MPRIAIIFDDRTRPETTGVYCRKALAEIPGVEVVFFHPDDLANVPRTGFDLYLVIDDGLDYPLPAGLHPLVYWAIDTHLAFERSLWRASQADFVFAAQRDGAARLRGVSGGGLRGSGIASARWLPLACDAEIHGGEGYRELVTGNGGGRMQAAEGGESGKKNEESVSRKGAEAQSDGGAEEATGERHSGAEGKDLAKLHEICFVGNLFPGPRSDLVRLLRIYYPEMYVGNAYFQDMARVYSASKIVFNRGVLNDLNMRVFEALASGSLLVTNVLAGNDPSDNGQGELFRDGVHLATYRTSDELLEKVRYYLEHDDERERIAAAGRAEALAKHTYRHRMEEVLRVVIGHLSLVIGTQSEASAERGARNAELADNEHAATAHGAEERQLAASTLTRSASKVGPRSGRRDVPTRSVGTSTGASAECGARSAELAEGTADRVQGVGGSRQKAVSSGDERQLAVSTVAHGASEAGPRSGRRDVRGTRAVGRRSVGTSAIDLSYYDFPRPDVLALVPTTAARVLDVGCGTGRLGEGIKARQSCEVVGVEANEQAAAVARIRLDQIYVGDFERLELQFPHGHFDAVVFADVLEHLLDPAAALARVRRWLRAGSVIVASIPNARHADVVRSLVEGNFTYQASGPLDNTHTAFFTRRNIAELFEAAGLTAVSWTAVPGPGYDEWLAHGRPGEIDLGRLQLVGFPEHEVQEFFVYQWLVVGKIDESQKLKVQSATSGANAVSGMPTSAEPGTRSAEQGSGSQRELSTFNSQLSTASAVPRSENPQSPVAEFARIPASGAAVTPRTLASPTTLNPKSKIQHPKSFPPCLLLMVTCNRLAHTKIALDSVLALDYPRLRIVVFDNASTDGSLEYLRERLRGEPRATLLASNVNRGVVYAMNLVWFGDRAGCEERSFAERKATMMWFGDRASGGRKATLDGAELLAKVDNDTWVPPDLLLRLADCHLKSERFGALSGFHFRAEGEALVEEGRAGQFDGVRVLAQPYVGGCAVMVRRAVLDRLGPIPLVGGAAQAGAAQDRTAEGHTAEGGGAASGGHARPVLDSGWTLYQQWMGELGLVNGYPWPPIHVDHMEDTRSPRFVGTAEHEEYKQDMRGMGLAEFTETLCVWRPIWGDKVESGKLKVESEGSAERGVCSSGIRENSDVDRESRSSTLTRSASKVPDRVANVHGQPAGILANPATPFTTHSSRLFFTQDFRRDFEQFDFTGPAFALARFADGERAICMGQAVAGADGWRYPGGASPFQQALLAALRFNDRDYFVGISDGCCDTAAKEWYLRQITLPLSHVTFSNIFVNGNYERFKRLDLSAATTVAPEGADYWVPEDVVGSNFNIDQLVARLLRVERTILVSAGPAAAIIIHRYWQCAPPERRRVIVDVGSAIDEFTKGRRTRQYQVPGSRNAELVCTW